jgi:hypothetical protein
MHYKLFLQELVMNGFQASGKSVLSIARIVVVFAMTAAFQLVASACPYEYADPRSASSLGKKFSKNWPETGQQCAMDYITPDLEMILGAINADARRCFKSGSDTTDAAVRKTTKAEMAVWLRSVRENFKEGKLKYSPVATEPSVLACVTSIFNKLMPL